MEPRITVHLKTFVEYLEHLRPQSILDIGIDGGRMGFLARDCLDRRAASRDRRRVRIDGLELTGTPVADHQRAAYDALHPAEALQRLEASGPYDLVVIADVLDRLEKRAGLALLDRVMAHAGRAAALFLPIGKTWPAEVGGPGPFAARRSTWFFRDLAGFSSSVTVMDTACGPYAAALVLKPDYERYRRAGEALAGRAAAEAASGGIRRRLGLEADALDAIDLRGLARHVADPVHRGYFLDRNRREHYPLIALLSTRFENALLCDIGTNKGYSALALSYHAANTVVSYDIVDCRALSAAHELERIEFRVGDATADPRLISAPLIVLDTDHDGRFEQRLYEHLREQRFRGFLFLDDIHLNSAMIRFWEGITEPKVDLTDLGHFTGSGLVDFSHGWADV